MENLALKRLGVRFARCQGPTAILIKSKLLEKMKKRARFLFAFSETTAPNGSQVDKLVILCKPKLPANVLPEHLVL